MSDTLATLRAEAQTMGEYYPPQIGDSEMNAYLNSALAAFQTRLAEIDETRIAVEDDLKPAAGDRLTDLPIDCEKPLVVAVEDSSSPVGYTQLERINAAEYYAYTGAVAVTKREVRYLLRAREIEWWPKASGDWIRLVYIPTLPGLSDSDSYDPGISGWKPWVLSHALIVCAVKLNESPQGWQQIHKAADERLVWQGRFDHARARRLSGAPPPYPTRKRFRY
jgi:hypothetical protein